MKYKVKFTETIEYEVEFDTANPIEEEEWLTNDWFNSMVANKPDWREDAEVYIADRTLNKHEVLFCEACELQRQGDPYFSGVPGIRAKLEGGKTDNPGHVIECCVCERYDHQEACAKLHELGILIDKE